MTKVLITLLLILSMAFANAQTESGTDSSSSNSSNSSCGSSGRQVVEEITCVAEDLKRMLFIRLYELFSKAPIEVEEY